MSILSIDFETRSTVDLKKSGVYVYAEHPNTDIWCMAWAFDDEEPEIWTPQAFTSGAGVHERPQLQRVVDHILAGGEIRAWNAQFERLIWREIMVKRYGAPAVQPHQWVCSAAEAAAMALPRYLGGAAHVLGVEQQKDDQGARLMLRMARPRRIEDDGTIIWWDVEEKKQQLYAYCQQDVRTERSLVKALRRLTPKEREIYLLDQRINDRGIAVDLNLVRAAQAIVEEAQTRANARLDDLTNGDVTAVTNNKRLLTWLNDNDAETASISKAALAALMERDDLTENVVEVLQLRTEAGRSSVAKLKSLILATCVDAVARGLLLYHGAGTGRWTGKLIQPHNFPRGEIKKAEQYIEWVMAGEYDLLDMIAPPIVIVLSMLRAMLTAKPGHELMAGDYSAIEARVLNWLAGQEDVVEMFRNYDKAAKADKPKFDPYRNMAVKMGRGAKPEDVTPEDRQAGKAAELGCGFQMGGPKFVSAAWSVYQVKVSEKEAKATVLAYRESHPMVKQYWSDIENACINATLLPGTIQTVGPRQNVKVTRRGGYLYVILPSGRPLVYAAPSVEDREVPWSTPENPQYKPSLHFWGTDPFTHQWGKMAAYGGLLTENIVQAIARDLLAEAMLRAETRGYMPVLSVHDEVVAEVPIGFGSVKEFEAIMSELPAWATGCPVAAEGWKGFRYRK